MTKYVLCYPLKDCDHFIFDSCITGEPTASRKPPKGQKWKKNSCAGGGAVIPCSWILLVSKEIAHRVKDVVEACLPDIEGNKSMEVKV